MAEWLGEQAHDIRSVYGEIERLRAVMRAVLDSLENNDVASAEAMLRVCLREQRASDG